MNGRRLISSSNLTYTADTLQQRRRRHGQSYGIVSIPVLDGCIEADFATPVGAFSVPLDSLGSLNKSSMIGDFRLVGEDRGGGVGGLLEGAHQIHCLVCINTYMWVEIRTKTANFDDTEPRETIHLQKSLGLQ